MISLLRSSKLILQIVFFIALNINLAIAEDQAEDIWEDKTEKINQDTQTTSEQDEIKIESPIISSDIEKIIIKVDEDKIEDFQQTLLGIFDPEENNFNLNMWSKSDGAEIKKILKRLNKLKLSKLSEEMLFQTLFTNAYPPLKNLDSQEFLKIKINWLIEKQRIEDLEIFLKNNPEVGKSTKAIKFLINEYLSDADIKSACNKINFIDKNIENVYLDKFIIYCLIHNDRKDEAQLIFDLLKEKGFKDNFFENKINFLLGITNTTDKKILDNNLLNFYLSHITNNDFDYKPNEKTDKYIWRYLSYANLIKVNDFEDENTITAYEQAASKNSFEKDEIFKIYLKMILYIC